MRLGILVGTLAILGVVAGKSGHSDLLETLKCVLMLIIVYGAIKVAASANRNVYVRCLYLSILEEKTKTRGFFSCWRQMIKKAPEDLSSHAVTIAYRIINICVAGYAVAMTLNQSYSSSLAENYPSSLFHAFALFPIIFTYKINESEIRKNFDINILQDQIYSNLVNAYDQLDKQQTESTESHENSNSSK